MQEGFHDSDGVAFEVCLDCGHVEHFIRFGLGELNESVKRETGALAARSRRRRGAAGDPPDGGSSDGPATAPVTAPATTPVTAPATTPATAPADPSEGPDLPGTSAR
jgi:hypothetical protein